MLLKASNVDRRLSLASIKCLHSLLPASYDMGFLEKFNYLKYIKISSVLLDTLIKSTLIIVIFYTEYEIIFTKI